ncbi:MAG: hypothetical protein ACTSQY_00705 [Candidatus Odinarchaeia archaeon]
MGLDIWAVSTQQRIYNESYSQLHSIRYLAMKLSGFRGDWQAAIRFEKEGKPWKEFPEFYQLLHFSDCEGILLKETFLTDIDISNSFEVGNLNKFYNELKTLNKALKNSQYEYEAKLVKNLVEGIYDELTYGEGIILFQ